MPQDNAKELNLEQFKGHTPGPWEFKPIEKWPFGVHVFAGNYDIHKEDAYAHSTTQDNRRENELGIGFKGAEADLAEKAIKTQDANARLIAAAPTLLAELIQKREECEMLREMLQYDNIGSRDRKIEGLKNLLE